MAAFHPDVVWARNAAIAVQRERAARALEAAVAAAREIERRRVARDLDELRRHGAYLADDTLRRGGKYKNDGRYVHPVVHRLGRGYDSDSSSSSIVIVPNETKKRKRSASSNAGTKKPKKLLTDKKFKEALRNVSGFTVVAIPGDGNCLFASFLNQLRLRDMADAHTVASLRELAVGYLEQHPLSGEDYEVFQIANPEYSSQTWSTYLKNMRKNKAYATGLELMALSRLFNVSVRVWTSSYYTTNQQAPPGFLIHLPNPLSEVNLSYHNGNHYNSLRSN